MKKKTLLSLAVTAALSVSMLAGCTGASSTGGSTGGSSSKGGEEEITVMGWGKRMRHIPIDHLILRLPPGEELTDLNNGLWDEYIQKILFGLWEREDGYVLRSVANGLDRSYQSRTIDNLFRRVQVPTCFGSSMRCRN